MTATTIEVAGRTLRVTNLDKVYYPETGTLKAAVLAYYQAIAPRLVPHAARRPATRKRWVDGVGTAAEPEASFFNKNLDAAGTPDWVHTHTIEHTDGPVTYPLVDDAPTLLWLAQLASLEIHVPQWRVGEDGRPANPDRLVIDLDPGPGVGMGELAEVAHLAREALAGVGLPSVPVTSGSTGIHLYAGLDGSLTSDEATELARELAVVLAETHPSLVVASMAKAARAGRVFIDWSQNKASKTTVTPYSLRGRPHPTVAAPRSWDEIDADCRQLEFDEVLARAEDPLAVLLR